LNASLASWPKLVTPAKAGVQKADSEQPDLDAGFRRHDVIAIPALIWIASA